MKDDRLYLVHMLETARKVQTKVENLQRQDYDANEDLRLALTHLLQMIGEAARQVSDVARQKMPEIPWPQVVVMRHRIVHEYMDVDLNIVWTVATQEMAPLIRVLEKVIDPRLLEPDAELDI